MPLPSAKPAATCSSCVSTRSTKPGSSRDGRNAHAINSMCVREDLLPHGHLRALRLLCSLSASSMPASRLAQHRACSLGEHPHSCRCGCRSQWPQWSRSRSRSVAVSGAPIAVYLGSTVLKRSSPLGQAPQAALHLLRRHTPFNHSRTTAAASRTRPLLQITRSRRTA